jgi:hypothetical protein
MMQEKLVEGWKSWTHGVARVVVVGEIRVYCLVVINYSTYHQVWVLIVT